MIIGIYAVLGSFLCAPQKIPWLLAIVDPHERINIPGDIAALFLVAFVLWAFMPKKSAILTEGS
jgi:hypothetical protein